MAASSSSGQLGRRFSAVTGGIVNIHSYIGAARYLKQPSSNVGSILFGYRIYRGGVEPNVIQAGHIAADAASVRRGQAGCLNFGFKTFNDNALMVLRSLRVHVHSVHAGSTYRSVERNLKCVYYLKKNCMEKSPLHRGVGIGFISTFRCNALSFYTSQYSEKSPVSW